jgi:hypothetical protein
MSSIEYTSVEKAAVRNDLAAIFVSLELSRSTWLVTSLSPGGGEKMSKHQVRSGDVAGLLARFSQLQAKSKARTGQSYHVIVIHEAGLDGFWIDRTLQNVGIESHVVGLRWSKHRKQRRSLWQESLLARRPINVVLVAIANKTARVVWAMLSRGETFRTARAAA